MIKLNKYLGSQFFLDLVRLSLIPAVIIPFWLLGISVFSDFGALPLGTALLAGSTIALAKKYRASFGDRPVVIEIATKLIMMCWSSLLVSTAFLLFQVSVWVWATQFSPTIQQLSQLLNKLPSKQITEITKETALFIRIGLVLSLALTFALAPLLSATLAKLSRRMSKAIDIAAMVVLTANLFLFYGISPAGLNTVRIVLRSEQSDISQLYREAVAKASKDILAQSIRNAIVEVNQANVDGQAPPPSALRDGPTKSPPNGGIGGPAPEKPPRIDPRMALNSWENGIYDNVIANDRRRTNEITRNTSRQIPAMTHSRPEGLAPKIANRGSLQEFNSIAATSSGPDTRIPNSETLEQIVKTTFDAIELQPLFQSTISQLSSETVIAEGIKDVIELFSDAVFQDGLRTVAVEMVNDFLSEGLRKSEFNAAVSRYANKFLTTTAGEKLKSAVQAIRGYSERVVERIASYRSIRSDLPIREGERSQLAELKRLVRDLAIMPDEHKFTTATASQLLRLSGEITDKMIDDLDGANISRRAQVMARLKRQVATASTPSEKSKAASELRSIAAAATVVSMDVVICKCVNRRTGIVVYSFFSERRYCQEGGAC